MRIITALVLLVSSVAMAQDNQPDWTQLMNEPNANFFEIQEQFETYWEGREREKGDGYKPFMRWMQQAQKHLNADGTLRSASDYKRVWEEDQEYKAARSLEGNWQELGPILDGSTTRDDIPGIGRINSIAFHPNDPNTLFAGAPAGGLWKTTDGGEWWVSLTDNLPSLGVSAIVIDPNNPDVMYIGTGDRDSGDAPGLGVWKSEDGGETWNEPGFGFPDLVVGMMVINPDDTDIVLAATNDGVYRTTNAGDNWALVSPSNNFKDIKLHPTNPDIVYATGSTSFYRSENGGASFDYIAGSISFSSRSVIGVCPQEPDLVYVCGANSTDFRAFFKSEDAGITWEEVSDSPNILGWSNDASGGQAWYDFCMAVNPQNPLDIFVGGVRVLRSLDGGVTWFEASNNYVHVDHHFCEFSPHSNNFWLGNDGGIYEFDNESVWTDKTNGMVVSQMYKLGQSPFNVNECLTGFQDNGTSEWNGVKWERRVGADGMECMYDHQDEDYFYGAIQNGQIRRTGPGYTAQTCADQNFGGITEGGAWVTPYVLDVENTNTMYLGYTNLWRCENIKDPNIDNVVWEQMSADLINNDNSRGNAIMQHPANPSNIYYSKTTRKLFRKDDINNTEEEWVNLSTNLPPYNLTVDDIEAHPFDENIIYIAFFQEVYKSVNKGEDWEQLTNDNFPDININSVIYDRNSDEGLYIGTEFGVYYKDATMEDWIPFSGGNLPGAVDVNELEIFYGETIEDSRIRAATYGRGLWESDLYDSETYYFPAKADVLINNDDGEVFGEFDVDIRFYKNLNYVDAETLELSEIMVTNGTVTALTGGPNTYTATISPDNFGEVTIYIPNDVAEDNLGVLTEESYEVSLAYNAIPEPLGIYGPGGVGSFDELSYWFQAGSGLLDSENGSTPGDMSPFGYWEDITGNGGVATQDTPDEQPLYVASSDLFNGQPAILFTEDSTWLRTNEVAVKENISAFCVASARNNPDGYTLWTEHGWLASAREENGFIIHPWKDAFKVTGMIYDNENHETQGLNTIFVPGINTATIHGMRYYNNSANKFLDSYVNGNLDRVHTNDVVRDAEDMVQVNFGRDFGDRYGQGMMAEQILYTERLYNVHTLLVRNYLSSKYSAPCDGLDRYTQDELYYHEVAGIGQMTEFDKHLDAQGQGIVRMNQPSAMDNGDFLLWGHNDGPLEWAWGDPVFNSGRLARVWGYEETGDAGTVTVSIEDMAVLNVIENIGIIWDEVSTFESSTQPNFEPLTLENGVWTADIDFSGKGVFTIGISPVLSTENIEAEFKLFPNPASSQVTLDFTALESVSNLEILNALGQVVILEPVTTSIKTLDISKLPSGNYFVKVSNSTGIIHVEQLEVIKE